MAELNECSTHNLTNFSKTSYGRI